jgi:hypothetical protein
MNQLTRPQFFEGQYIGADDLQTIVAYARARHAQHLLAGHSWGIAAGLELVEQPSPDGSVAVWLQPGYAWDGYGRPILVDTPTPIGLQQLQGKPPGAFFVWLSYMETQQDAARASYGVCEGTDTFLRIAESFQITVTGIIPLDAQESGVMEAGTLRPDARLVRRLFQPDGPFLCDASVPEQGDNPLGGKALWLVPAGLVGWTGSVIRALSDDEKKGARLFRRHVGAVAENIFAPGGLLRLRSPLTYPAAGTPDTDVGKVCAAGQPVTTDLIPDGTRVKFDDLVWVEGNLRVLGQTRLWGGALELRDSTGAQPSGALFVRRNPKPAAAQDLELALGDAPSAAAVNRLVAGPVDSTAPGGPKLTPAFIVNADGRTQIGGPGGVAPPALALDIKGDFGRDDGPATIHLMGSRIGDVGDGKLMVTSGGALTAFGDDKSNQQVAIRTTTPSADVALDVNGGIGVTSNPAFLRLLGSELRDQGDGVLRIRSGGATVAFDGADQVGINKANPAPGLALDINGAVGITSAPASLTLLGSQLADQNDVILRFSSGGATVAFDGNDRVGINTALPSATLHVNGDARIDGAIGVGGAAQFGGNLNTGGNGHIGGNLHVSGLISSGPSDRRLKRDIKPLKGALQSLLSLRGVSFQWASPDAARLRPGSQTGFIADEVEQVFPQWVVTAPDGTKTIAYSGFEALVVEALRQLAGEVEKLTEENEKLRERLGRKEPAAAKPRAATRRSSRGKAS